MADPTIFVLHALVVEFSTPNKRPHVAPAAMYALCCVLDKNTEVALTSLATASEWPTYSKGRIRTM